MNQRQLSSWKLATNACGKCQVDNDVVMEKVERSSREVQEERERGRDSANGVVRRLENQKQKGVCARDQDQWTRGDFHSRAHRQHGTRRDASARWSSA